MWISDKWESYTLLDAANGKRYEDWGGYTLVRPDPQVIWQGDDSAWKSDAVYKRSKSGGGAWNKNTLPESWQIPYGDLTFNIKAFSFKHTGLFPEQATNWDFMRSLIKSAKEKDPDREIRVLNLFAYTGGATIACAKEGAKVTHVDSSRGMVTWANENAASSNIDRENTRWMVDDCMKFVKKEIRREKKYEGIVLDPPSYGRGPSGEIWKLEDNIHDLLKELSNLLSDEPLFLILNSYTTGLQSGVLTYLMSTALEKYKPQIESDELGLPVKSTGLVLPCGCCSRAVFK